MFHTIKLKKIDFVSNPPLEPRVVVQQSIRSDGTPVNLFMMTERDHKGMPPAHYDESIMSLRAKLNRGVQLQTVNYDMTENDPNKLSRLAHSMTAELLKRSSERQYQASLSAASAAAPSSVFEPSSNVEPSK